MRRVGVLMAFLSVGLLALGGCADKLKHETKFSLPDNGDPDKMISPPMQKSSQDVTVSVTASEPVDVYVVTKKESADPRDLAPADREKKALGSKKGMTADSFTVKVPAKEEYNVVVGLSEKSKKADVTVKLTN